MPFPGEQTRTTPEDFARLLAAIVGPNLAKQILAAMTPEIRAILKEAPAKLYEVIRKTAQGPQTTQVNLAQIMGELTDELKISNAINQYLINTNAQLVTELQESTKIGKEILRKRKRREEDE